MIIKLGKDQDRDQDRELCRFELYVPDIKYSFFVYLMCLSSSPQIKEHIWYKG